MKISFKNFRSFGKSTSLDLRKFNVLIGPNSSGKSSLSKFISHYVNFVTSGLDSFSNIKVYKDITLLDTFDQYEIDKTLSHYIDQRKPENLMLRDKENFKRTTLGRNIFPKYYMTNTNSDDPKNYDYYSKHNHNFKVNYSFLTNPSSIEFDYTISTVNRPILARRPLFNNSRRNSWVHNEFIYVFEENVSNKDYMKFYNFIVKNWSLFRDNHQHKLKISLNEDIVHKTFDSKNYLLKDLNVFLDRNSDSSCIFFNENSQTSKVLMDVINSSTIEVFNSSLNYLEDKFSSYIKVYKDLNPKRQIRKYPLTMNYDTDYSNYKFKKQFKNIKDEKTLEKYVDFLLHPYIYDGSLQNFWRKSPYITSLFFKYKRRNKSSEILPFMPNIETDPIYYIRRRPVGTGRTKIAMDIYMNSPLQFFEFEHYKIDDFDFYKDFTLVSNYNSKEDKIKPSKVLKDLPSEYKFNAKKTIHPSWGVFFKIGRPTLKIVRTDEKKSVRRNLISELEEVESFLVKVGAQSILRDFTKVSYKGTQGKVETFIFSPRKSLLNEESIFKIVSSGGNLRLLDYYIDHFKASMEECSIFKEEIDNDRLEKVSKEYKVSKDAIKNQIDVIKMYLLRSTIVQFQMNLSKYLFNEYYIHLKDLKINFEHDSFYPYYIKPNNGELFYNSRDNFITADNLIKFFGPNSKKIFLDLKGNQSDMERLSRFNKFINESLKKIGMNFSVRIRSINYYFDKNSEFKNKWVGNLFEFVFIENNEIPLEITGRGMGDAAIVSLIGNLFDYRSIKNNENNLLIISEPEAYLHPNLISRVVDFLIDFADSNKRKNLKIIIESHSEVVLRTLQANAKKLKYDDNDIDNLFGVFFIDKIRGSHLSKIVDLGVKSNGFLKTKIPNNFYDINLNLASKLWDDK